MPTQPPIAAAVPSKAALFRLRKDDDDDNMKDEEDSVKQDFGDESEDDNAEDGGVTASGQSDGRADMQNLLYLWQHSFEKQLRQQNKGLCVKDLILTFDPETVYGQRKAFLKGMMITVSFPQTVGEDLDLAMKSHRKPHHYTEGLTGHNLLRLAIPNASCGAVLFGSVGW